MEKGDYVLPPYSEVDQPPAFLLPRWASRGGPPRGLRRRGRLLRLVGLACLLYIGYAQWSQLQGSRDRDRTAASSGTLSLQKLQHDLATCASLQQTPADATGAGRAKNARILAGQRPTLIRNATVWVGEAEAGTSARDARAGKGFHWTTADVYLADGLIQQVASSIALDAVAASAVVWDAHGRQLTAGLIDMHSHAGVDSLPELRGNEDTNEMSSDVTPYVRSIDGIQPQDHQIQVIKSGGVTTSLVLPGSGNNIGGEAHVIKHAVGLHDGRPDLSIDSLLAAPDARDLRYIKMACGENAKRIYGKTGEHGPVSRLGESWEFRHAFEQAAELKQAQDDWCAAAATSSGGDAATLQRTATTYLPRNLQWDTLAAVLRGQVRVNTHCYTIPDLEAFIDHTNEFQFPLWAFHHAHQTYLVPEVLKRAWGADRFGPPASALFADNMYYKAESFVASEFAGKILYENGLTPIYVSDNPVLNAQHVLFEAAKAYHYGLPYHAALAAVTSAPAERLGLGNRLGRIKPGFDADIVVWDSDPLSVGAAPVQVWIDGLAQFDNPVELKKPFTAPIVPDETLAQKSNETLAVVGSTDESIVLFTGVKKVLFSDDVENAFISQGITDAGVRAPPFNVAVSGGKITCIGACSEQVAQVQQQQDHQHRLVPVENGYLSPAFTALGSLLGLLQIDAESSTDNGGSDGGKVFSRAVDGLALGGKKLDAAYRYGVTRAVSAPKFSGGFTHHGTSVGFLTGSGSSSGADTTKLSTGVVYASDVAVHYTLSQAAKKGSPSLSGAIGTLRSKLLDAVASAGTAGAAAAAAPYSESAYLQKVVAGELALVVTAHSADTIASVLSVKKDVEAAMALSPSLSPSSSPSSLRVVILGGAESPLVAGELAAAGVGVVLAPLQSYRATWEERRALTGAPLTNGTAVDVLVDAGVVVAIGPEEDWLVRDFALLAGIAYRNGGGRLSEKAAIALVSDNVHQLLQPRTSSYGSHNSLGSREHFVVYEGSPLEIGSKIRAVGGGLGHTTLFVRPSEE